MTNEAPGTATLQAIQRELTAYITMNFLYDGQASRLQPQASLVEEGIVDPTGMLELVLWIEESYGFTVGEDDIGPQTFASVESISRYILGRLANE